MDKQMDNANIKTTVKKAQMQVYCRIRPNFKDTEQFPYQIQENGNVLSVQNINKSYKENLTFNYSGVYDEEASQEVIFDNIALPVIHNCLEGYNGTLFCYGQTGSGKTYTMSGAESWQMRGVIPRVLQCIFDQVERVEGIEYTLYVSFMEIYNENAYDLLEKKHLETPLETWNKINLFEDDYHNIHLKNISVHQCKSEQEGIDWLMFGNFIRQVSATPSNQSSSRSHCVFTITIEGKQLSTSSIFVSKLHLVDLAGSERAGRNQAEGSLLNEAKYINLSLTYLEQVILALNEKRKNPGGRTHIPYRNSLLTTILKDSLGGNCKTVMIANISTELDNLEESISTLRFSQRVAALENEIIKKEQVDLQLMVKRLEQEKLSLMQEVGSYQNILQQLGSNGQDSQQILNMLQQQNYQGTSFSKSQLQMLQNNNNQIIKKGNMDDSDNKSNANNNKSYNQKEGCYESNPETHKNFSEVILNKVDLFLNENDDKLQIQDMEDAFKCFYAMKQLYNTRMKEYVSELTFISQKLQKYDQLLSKRKQVKQEQQLQQQQIQLQQQQLGNPILSNNSNISIQSFQQQQQVQSPNNQQFNINFPNSELNNNSIINNNHNNQNSQFLQQNGNNKINNNINSINQQMPNSPQQKSQQQIQDPQFFESKKQIQQQSQFSQQYLQHNSTSDNNIKDHQSQKIFQNSNTNNQLQQNIQQQQQQQQQQLQYSPKFNNTIKKNDTNQREYYEQQTQQQKQMSQSPKKIKKQQQYQQSNQLQYNSLDLQSHQQQQQSPMYLSSTSNGNSFKNNSNHRIQ